MQPDKDPPAPDEFSGRSQPDVERPECRTPPRHGSRIAEGPWTGLLATCARRPPPARFRRLCSDPDCGLSDHPTVADAATRAVLEDWLDVHERLQAGTFS